MQIIKRTLFCEILEMFLNMQNVRVRNRLILFILVAVILYIIIKQPGEHEKIVGLKEFDWLEYDKKTKFFRRTGTRLNDITIESIFDCLSTNFHQALDDLRVKSFNAVYETLDELINVFFIIIEINLLEILVLRNSSNRYTSFGVYWKI